MERGFEADRQEALALTPVSRETAQKLEAYVELLRTWQKTTNLVAPSTLPRVWTRHVADSLQLMDLAPEARRWIDLGSGAGFPGMAIACALPRESEVHLVESSQKKAAFLRAAVRVTGAPAVVHAKRIEDFIPELPGKPDVVTARALAPLNLLLGLSFPLIKAGALALFPKGQDIVTELSYAARYWEMEYTLTPSRTDPAGRIVVVRRLEPRGFAIPRG